MFKAAPRVFALPRCSPHVLEILQLSGPPPEMISSRAGVLTEGADLNVTQVAVTAGASSIRVVSQ